MLNVKILMHQQEKQIKKETQLTTHGQQEGQSAMTYRTKKYLLDKRRQIKQSMTDAKKDNQKSLSPPRVHNPDLLSLLDPERSMETIKYKLGDKQTRMRMTKGHKDQLCSLLDQIDLYYDSYQKLYDPVLQQEIRQQGGFGK